MFVLLQNVKVGFINADNTMLNFHFYRNEKGFPENTS